jgi:hypothetical protein
MNSLQQGAVVARRGGWKEFCHGTLPLNLYSVKLAVVI